MFNGTIIKSFILKITKMKKLIESLQKFFSVDESYSILDSNL
ncbi:hypothetical protein BH11BAC4_BH11BAC4_21760 [soil metagenome]